MKKLIALGLAVVMLLTFGAGTALAEEPQHATGGASFVWTGGQRISFTFNVQSTGDGLGTGVLHYFVHREFVRQMMCDVKYVMIDGNTAWFAAECVYDSYPEGALGSAVGAWVYVKVVDNGEPGVGSDYIGRSWIGSSGWLTEPEAAALVSSMATPQISGVIETGNLQVRSQ
jgi:hypothetical protein